MQYTLMSLMLFVLLYLASGLVLGAEQEESTEEETKPRKRALVRSYYRVI